MRGIKTTIPFFQWILESADFVHGQFDTAFLDHELARRAGRPFVATPDEAEDLAVMATAVRSFVRAAGASAREGRAPVAGGWTLAARREALRR